MAMAMCRFFFQFHFPYINRFVNGREYRGEDENLAILFCAFFLIFVFFLLDEEEEGKKDRINNRIHVK
jgi:hypothetical protein